jgi:hypothetical protein
MRTFSVTHLFSQQFKGNTVVLESPEIIKRHLFREILRLISFLILEASLCHLSYTVRLTCRRRWQKACTVHVDAWAVRLGGRTFLNEVSRWGRQIALSWLRTHFSVSVRAISKTSFNSRKL